MDAPDLADISSFAAPVYVALILLEIVLIVRFRVRGDYEAKDARTSLLMGAGSLFVKIVFGGTIFAGITALYFWVYQYRMFEIGFAWWAFLVCFVLDDFVYYWNHRWEHTIRWAWANHVVHHSSQHFNLTTALRQPWFGFLKGFFVLSVPLVWIGFHPAMIAFVSSLNLFYQFFVHTEAIDKLPRPIELIFNTPSHHRVHHGKNPKYLDANYAGVLIIWDRMFGTFVPEDKDEPVSYGLVRDIGTFNPLRVAVHEYVSIVQDVLRPGLRWRERLGYIIARPGWSHDGGRQTSLDIKRDAGLS
ncbi:MAG: sterol desaturase family protein [Pseudomonadota bacterium]